MLSIVFMSCFGALHWSSWRDYMTTPIISMAQLEPTDIKYCYLHPVQGSPAWRHEGGAWLDRTLRVYFQDESCTWLLAEGFGSTPSQAPVRLLEHPHDMAADFSGGHGLREKRRRKPHCSCCSSSQGLCSSTDSHCSDHHVHVFINK